MSDHACKHGIERCERCEAARAQRTERLITAVAEARAAVGICASEAVRDDGKRCRDIDPNGEPCSWCILDATLKDGDSRVMEWAKTAEDISDKALATFIKRAEEALESSNNTLTTWLADALTNLEQALRQRDEARARAERAEAEIRKIEDDQEVCPWAAKCKHLAALRKKVSAPCTRCNHPFADHVGGSTGSCTELVRADGDADECGCLNYVGGKPNTTNTCPTCGEYMDSLTSRHGVCLICDEGD